MVPGGQGMDLQSPRGSRRRSKGFQGVKAWAYRVQEGQGVGLHGPRVSSGRPTGSQGVKG